MGSAGQAAQPCARLEEVGHAEPNLPLMTDHRIRVPDTCRLYRRLVASESGRSMQSLNIRLGYFTTVPASAE